MGGGGGGGGVHNMSIVLVLLVKPFVALQESHVSSDIQNLQSMSVNTYTPIHVGYG